MSADRPNGSQTYWEYLTGMPKGHDKHLKWIEAAKLVSDL